MAGAVAENVQLALFAPGHQSVVAQLESAGASPRRVPLSCLDGTWRAETGLEPGRHRYRYLVDDKIVVGDPCARQVERGADDSDPAYAVIEVGATPYTWKHDGSPLPRYRDLIIYEVLVHDFSPTRDFRGVIDKLDHLQQLGINALELMPVFAGDVRDIWGYEPNYFMAPEPEYGTPDDLKELVDQAHARGMVVLLDIIFAHTGHMHPFERLETYFQSPWYGAGFGKKNEYGLPVLDHGKPATAAFCCAVLQHWLCEYHVDGFRLDYVNLIQEHRGKGVPWLIRDIRSVKQDAIVILEMIPEHLEKIQRWDADGAWHIHSGRMLWHVLMTDANPKKARECGCWCEWIRELRESGRGKRIHYTETHDDQRHVKEFLEAGLGEAEARERAKTAASILLTMPGVIQLYHGQEWGEPTARSEKANPLHWELLGTPSGRGLFEWYCQMTALRHAHPALRTRNLRFVTFSRQEPYFAYLRWDDAGDAVLVAANFSPRPRVISLGVPGEWEGVGEAPDFADSVQAPVAPYRALVWVKRP